MFIVLIRRGADPFEGILNPLAAIGSENLIQIDHPSVNAELRCFRWPLRSVWSKDLESGTQFREVELFVQTPALKSVLNHTGTGI